jgi:hypothetical protein
MKVIAFDEVEDLVVGVRLGSKILFNRLSKEVFEVRSRQEVERAKKVIGERFDLSELFRRDELITLLDWVLCQPQKTWNFDPPKPEKEKEEKKDEVL